MNSAEIPSMYHVLWSRYLPCIMYSGLDTFHVSCALVCQFLLAAQFIETSVTKSVFLWYRSQRDLHLFCKFRLTFTWTNNDEKSSYHDREFPVTIRNELILSLLLFSTLITRQMGHLFCKENVKKSCRYGEYGSVKHLLFLLLYCGCWYCY